MSLRTLPLPHPTHLTASALFVLGLALAAVASATVPQIRELASPARADQSMILDTRRERILMFGGDDPSSRVAAPGVWEWVPGAPARWTPFAVLGDGPLPRSGMAALYDSLRDRVLVFGGRETWSGFSSGGQLSNELWSLSLSGTPEWTKLGVSPTPIPNARFDASMVLDGHDRLVMFGGDGGAVNDSSVWLLSLSALPLQWQSVDLPGVSPGPRARHGAVYCPATDRMTVFGGDRLIVSGAGIHDYTLRPAITWELTLAGSPAWLQRSAAPADSVPLPETGGPLVCDSSGEFAVLLPGSQNSSTNVPAPWRLDLLSSTWTRLATVGPSPGLRSFATGCPEPAIGGFLFYGGGGSLFGSPTDRSPLASRLFLSLPSSQWSNAITLPALTNSGQMQFDPATQQILLRTAAGISTFDVQLGAWSLDPAATVNPPPTLNTTSVYDWRERKVLVLGGPTSGPQELWTWSLDVPSGWTSTPISGPPQLISGIPAVLDTVGQRVIMVPSLRTGQSLAARIDTVITLSLGSSGPAWIPVIPAGTAPRVRRDARLVVDDQRGRVILIGGSTPDLGGSAMNDVWSLSLAGGMAWSNPLPFDNQFLLGGRMGAIIDPTQDRALVVAGASVGVFSVGGYQTLATLPLSNLSSLLDLDPGFTSRLSGEGVAFFDPVHDRALFWNNTLWELTWDFGSPVSLGAGTATSDVSGIHLHWAGPVLAPYAATVERSADGGVTWSHLAIVTQQPDGSLDATDATPPPGGPFVYRVLIERHGQWRVIGTAALGNLGAPLSERPRAFALAPLRPNPSHGDVTLELASPVDAEVTIEVFDASGRRVSPVLHRRVAAGSVAFSVPLARGLSPGLYLVRARDGVHTAQARLAVTR